MQKKCLDKNYINDICSNLGITSGTVIFQEREFIKENSTNPEKGTVVFVYTENESTIFFPCPPVCGDDAEFYHLI